MNSDELQFENSMVLTVVQALIGAVTANIMAVSLSAKFSQSDLRVYYAVDWIDPRFDDLVEQIETDIEGLTAGAVRIQSEVWEGSTWATEAWEGRNQRFVFARATASLWLDPNE